MVGTNHNSMELNMIYNKLVYSYYRIEMRIVELEDKFIE